MRTWLVIYKEKGETKTRVIMAKEFGDVISEILVYLALGDIKGIFEVAI
jgi:hypothetical protein